MTSTQESAFRFLALPPEIRNHVYADILTTAYRAELLSLERPSSRHAILQVSKLVYYEAERSLYKNGTFVFVLSLNRSLAFYQELSRRPLLDLIQNVTIHLESLDKLIASESATLGPTILVLDLFSDPAVPRTRCTVGVCFAEYAVFLFEDAFTFLDRLGKLTGFETVQVGLRHLHRTDEGGQELLASSYETLNERLSVMLGPEKGGGKVNPAGEYCLTYHPRGHKIIA